MPSTIRVLLLCLVMGGPAFRASSGPVVVVPKRSDWSAPREVVGLRMGPQGAWDDSLPGAITPCTVTTLDETYLLYYVGSDGTRDHDDGPAHRKLGLATSTNGIDFVKHDGNPILTWSPQNNDEEGIFGAKAVQFDGRIYLYVNTISAHNATTDQVNADVHLFTSPDGKHFGKPTLVLDHSNAEVVGHGDELGPTGILHSRGQWSLYYYAKGRGVANWGLCLASGTSPTSFTQTQPVIDQNAFFGTGGDVHWLSDSQIAMFFQRRSEWRKIEVYTASAAAPDKLTRARTWDGFARAEGVTVFLDKRAGKWFLYDADGGKVYVRTAPVQYETKTTTKEP